MDNPDSEPFCQLPVYQAWNCTWAGQWIQDKAFAADALSNLSLDRGPPGGPGQAIVCYWLA